MKLLSSPKTSAAGIGMILLAVGTVLTAFGDEGGMGQIDWHWVVAEIVGGIGLLMSRDNDRTSEEAGAAEAAAGRSSHNAEG